MSFNGVSLSNSMKSHLKKMGINELFKVQEEAYSLIFDGNDVVIHSKTGSGKTLAFGVPLMERVVPGRRVQMLALAPTRELARQISDQLEQLSRANVLPVYGGVNISGQIWELRKGVDVVVGTPGRIWDLILRKDLVFNDIKHVVLDEVDKMMDMGFKEAVENILNVAFDSVSEKPQLVLLSATMPDWIYSAAKTYMKNYKLINTVTSSSKTPVSVKHVAVNVEYWGLICSINHMVLGLSSGRCIIFVDTKQMISDISGEVAFPVAILHGDIEQNRRESVLNAFRTGEVMVLLCTDVASRGIDIPDVELVLQCNPPRDPDNYIHRSGRTGRAGKEGLSVCLYSTANGYDERLLTQIEKKAGFRFDSFPAISDAVFNQIVSKTSQVDSSDVDCYSEAANILLSSRDCVRTLAAMISLMFADKPDRDEFLLNDTFKQDFSFGRKSSNKDYERGSSYKQGYYNERKSSKQDFDDRRPFGRNNYYEDRRSSNKQDFYKRSRDNFFNKSNKDLKWERGSQFSFK